MQHVYQIDQSMYVSRVIQLFSTRSKTSLGNKIKLLQNLCFKRTDNCKPMLLVLPKIRRADFSCVEWKQISYPIYFDHLVFTRLFPANHS